MSIAQKKHFPFKSAASKSCQNVVGKCRFLVGECRLWVGQCRLFVVILDSKNNNICKNALRQTKMCRLHQREPLAQRAQTMHTSEGPGMSRPSTTTQPAKNHRGLHSKRRRQVRPLKPNGQRLRTLSPTLPAWCCSSIRQTGDPTISAPVGPIVAKRNPEGSVQTMVRLSKPKQSPVASAPQLLGPCLKFLGSV